MEALYNKVTTPRQEVREGDPSTLTNCHRTRAGGRRQGRESTIRISYRRRPPAPHPSASGRIPSPTGEGKHSFPPQREVASCQCQVARPETRTLAKRFELVAGGQFQ